MNRNTPRFPKHYIKYVVLYFIGIVVTLLILVVSFLLYSTSDMSKDDFVWNPPLIDRTKNQYLVMTANVGNSDWDCTPYKWKLCKNVVEQKLREHLQIVKPDIIALQELLPPWLCQNASETGPNEVCHNPQNIPQVRRLLGPDYTIVCEPHVQYECLGVKKDIGHVNGCPDGGFCYSARSADPGKNCDAGFSISSITVQLNNGAVFDVVNAHPQSWSASCRANMLLRAFNGDTEDPPIIQNDKVLILGDFNLDPWRSNDESVNAWQSIFEKGWASRDYRYHSAIAETNPPYYTWRFILQGTYDLVASNFASGICHVMGETPGTTRLDGGSGNDHRAVFGVLVLPPE